MEMKSSSQALIQQAKEKINEMKLLVANDPYRLDYHIMPPVGLLNDPNGFVYFNGYYHLFYQWNPFATTHGAKFWGHVFSKDLVHWHQAEIALAPDQWYDKNGCYSGSAIVNKEKLYLFYTGNVKMSKESESLINVWQSQRMVSILKSKDQSFMCQMVIPDIFVTQKCLGRIIHGIWCSAHKRWKTKGK